MPDAVVADRAYSSGVTRRMLARRGIKGRNVVERPQRWWREIDVRAVLHRFGVRDGDDIDADGDGVRPDEAHGFNVGHTGSLAGNTAAERLRPKPAERVGGGSSS